MGKFNIFKKFGEKSKAPEENPYQAQPAANQNPYGQPPQTQSWQSSKSSSTLPRYTENATTPDQKTPPPGYVGTPSSTATRPGYTSESLGAQHGVGRTQRYDTHPGPAQSEQRSYGGFDAPDERLFPANYGPPKPAPPPTYSQHGPDGITGPGEDGGHGMTDDEQAKATYAQANECLDQGVVLIDNIKGLALRARDRLGEVDQTTQRQGNMMDNAYKNLATSSAQAKIATRTAEEVGRSGKMMGGIGQDQRDSYRNKAASSDLQATEQLLEAQRLRREELERNMDRDIRQIASKQRTLGRNGTKNPNRFDCEEADEMEAKDQYIEAGLQQVGVLVNEIHQQSVVLNHRLEYQVQQAATMAEMAERAKHHVGKGQTVLNGYLAK